MRRHPHEWPEKQPEVKKKQNFCGLNRILWRFAAEVGVTDARWLNLRHWTKCLRLVIGVKDGTQKRGERGGN
jgi:hypothetical protein